MQSQTEIAASVTRPTIITRPRNTAPNEELQLRLTAVRPLLKLADHEVAALLHETRLELVEDDGAIRFEIAGRKHEFYAADSPTCQDRRGQKVLVAFSRSFTDVIFVVQADRKYIDTIPLRGALKWFDYSALGVEIREQETVLKRAAKELEELHGGEIQERAYAGRGNVAKVAGWRDARILHTFPQPALESDQRSAVSDQTEFQNSTRNAPPSEELLANDSARVSRRDPAAEYGADRVPLSPEHAVTGDPSRAATPPTDGGALQLRPKADTSRLPDQNRGTPESVAHETNRAIFNSANQRSHHSASATSPDAGAGAVPVLLPAPRHNLSIAGTITRAGAHARRRLTAEQAEEAERQVRDRQRMARMAAKLEALEY